MNLIEGEQDCTRLDFGEVRQQAQAELHMDLHGKNLIGGKWSGEGTARFSGVNPATEQKLEPLFFEATEVEIDRALAVAEGAFEACREQSPARVAGFLEGIGEEILGLGDELI